MTVSDSKFREQAFSPDYSEAGDITDDAMVLLRPYAISV